MKTITIQNPSETESVVIYECGTMNAIVIPPSSTVIRYANGVQIISEEAEAEYFENYNGFQGISVTVSGSEDPTTGSVSLTVQNSSQEGVSTATLVAGDVSFSGGTGGVYTASDVPEGNLTITISASGYVTEEVQLEVIANQTVTATVTLESEE